MDWHDVLEPLSTASASDSHETSALVQQLHETVAAAWQACQSGDTDQSQQLLATALPQLMHALHTLGVDPVQALRRQTVPPIPQEPGKRLLYIEGNRVEVRVDGELRGSWSIWSIADLKEVCRLAEEFDCALVYSIDATQSLDMRQGAA